MSWRSVGGLAVGLAVAPKLSPGFKAIELGVFATYIEVARCVLSACMISLMKSAVFFAAIEL